MPEPRMIGVWDALVLVPHEDMDYGNLIVNVNCQLIAVNQQAVGGILL